MSHNGAASAMFPNQARESLATSRATTAKYPASATTAGHSYPEVAPVMTQPPLQSCQQPNAGYSQQEYQYQNGYAPEAGKSVPPSQKPNPWGLSPLAFGLLVAAITAAIVGAAVGGGVAGAMLGNDSKSSSTAKSTVTVTATANPTVASTGSSSTTSTSGLPLPSSLENFVVPEPYYIDTLSNPGCPDGNSRIDVQYDTSFDLFCGVDMQNHIADESNPNLLVADVVGIFAYSITDCLYACSNAINFVERWGQDVPGGNMQTCKGVTWQYQMASSNSSNFANCWLKNGTSTGFQCNTCISAKLVT